MSETRRTILRKKKVRTPYIQDALIFFVFILIATFFWFLYAFSKTSETEFVFKLKYKNIPSKYIFSEKVPDSITVQVQDVGFNHFFYSISKPPKSITIDLKDRFTKTEKPIEITHKELYVLLKDVLAPSAKFRFGNPRKFNIEYGKLYHKHLRVKLNGDIKLFKQYTLRDSIKLKPSEVDVYGTKESLDTMRVVYTQPLYLKGLKETTFKTLDFNLPEGARIEPKQVDVTIPVELFTEKTLSIPVKGMHAPNDTQIRTFPAFVNVTFFVGLSQFDKIKADAFSAYVDYKNIVMDKTGKQTVIVVKNKSLNISNLRVTPKLVEYILEDRYE